MVMVSTFFTSGIFAKYTAEDGGDDSAAAAQFVFHTERTTGVELIDISTIRNPGDKVEYEFKVSNSDGARVCEVAQTYTVNVHVEGNMPIKCTLEKNGGASDTLNTYTDPSDRDVSLGAELVAKTEQNDIYLLSVEWPSDAKDDSYANGMAIGRVTLTVTSAQKG